MMCIKGMNEESYIQTGFDVTVFLSRHQNFHIAHKERQVWHRTITFFRLQ